MGAIDLEDVKVSYEGEALSAVNLISKLQMQLHETAAQLAIVTKALRDLQTVLLDSRTVEVKLTLSKEDYGKIAALAGTDDSDRIRKIVMSAIHAEKALDSSDAAELALAMEVVEPVDELPPRTLSVIAQISPSAEYFSQARPSASDDEVIRRATTKCPKCQALIDLPDDLNDQWPVEVKCEQCGVKCLVKSRSASGMRTVANR